MFSISVCNIAMVLMSAIFICNAVMVRAQLQGLEVPQTSSLAQCVKYSSLAHKSNCFAEPGKTMAGPAGPCPITQREIDSSPQSHSSEISAHPRFHLARKCFPRQKPPLFSSFNVRIATSDDQQHVWLGDAKGASAPAFWPP